LEAAPGAWGGRWPGHGAGFGVGLRGQAPWLARGFKVLGFRPPPPPPSEGFPAGCAPHTLLPTSLLPWPPPPPLLLPTPAME
jgi:hypothetical protein